MDRLQAASHPHHCCQHHHIDSTASHHGVVARPVDRDPYTVRKRKPRRIIVSAVLVALLIGIGGGTAYKIDRNRIDHTCFLTVNCNIPTEQHSTHQQ